jgi:hypothetical protein
VIGTTHAGDVETLVNRVVEQNVPTYLLDEVDLLVFPRHVDGERYVGEVVEFVDEDRFREFDRERDDDQCGVVRKDDATVYWNTVASRRHNGTYEFAYDHPALGDEERQCRTTVFEGIAEAVDRPVERVEESFHRKHRYVRYLQREGITDGDELFAFLADLRTDEAATVERLQRRTPARPGTGQPVDLPADTENESGGDTVVGPDSGPPSTGPQTGSRSAEETPDPTGGPDHSSGGLADSFGDRNDEPASPLDAFDDSTGTTDDVPDESEGVDAETSGRDESRPGGVDDTGDETTGRVDPSGEEDGD